ncbi:MAG TPA: ABC transporter permease [Solirubrobacteraceae bacterium]|nr:ABC transporter permease [Solirubrobacteraceae bacterium]
MAAVTAAPTASARGPFALALHATRYELRSMSRNPRARFFTVAFPVLLLVIFGAIFGDAHTTVDGVEVTVTRFYVPGIIAMTVVTSCFVALVNSVVTRRQQGLYKRRRGAPIPSWTMVTGAAVSTTAIAAAASALLLVIGRVAYGVGVSAEALAAVAATVLVGALALCAIGFAVAAFVPSPDAAQPITQAIVFPLFFLSGIWFSTDGMPAALDTAAHVFPVAHLADALHQAFIEGTFAPGDLAVLALWGALGALVATRRFSWLPSRANG